MVNATDATDVVTLSNNTAAYTTVSGGSFSTSTMTATGFSSKFIVYIEDGKIFKTDLLTGNTIQVSSITDATNIGESIIAINSEPGYIEASFENGTKKAIVPLNLPADQSPTEVPGRLITEIRDFKDNGRLIGFLFLNGTAIERCDIGAVGVLQSQQQYLFPTLTK